MNNVVLLGRLTADPEYRDVGETTLVSFRIAVDRKDKNDNTDFINCHAWASTADFINKWFVKGSPLCVSGRLESNSYVTKDGEKRTGHSVKVERCEFVPKDATLKTEPVTVESINAPREYDSFAKADEDIPF